MSDYDIYVLILCLIVFVLLVTLSAISLGFITRMYKRLICCGEEDEKLLKELDKRNRSCGRAGDIVAFVFNILICILFVGVLCFSLYINTQDAAVSDTVPTLRVVKSDSMSEKYSTNTYLTENNLDDQFDTFDIILTYKMPDEFELELYDIVVYEYRDTLVIHRIIAIEEPNENHPDSRLFTLRGDANQYSDSLKVEYSQMKGIYRGERVRYVGSFILFMQSPAGWLCVVLIVAVVFIAPALESYIGKYKEKRLQEMGMLPDGKGLAAVPTPIPVAEPARAAPVSAPANTPAVVSSGSPVVAQTPTYAATNGVYGGLPPVPPVAPYVPPAPTMAQGYGSQINYSNQPNNQPYGVVKMVISNGRVSYVVEKSSAAQGQTAKEGTSGAQTAAKHKKGGKRK